MRRRQFIRLASAGLATTGVIGLRGSGPARAAVTRRARPRTLLQLWFAGGIDPILCVDPKRASEIGSNVDRPYGDGDIFAQGGVRLAPAVHSLHAQLASMAIVNGVTGHTVSHQTGASHVFHMRQFYPKRAAGLSGSVGGSLRARLLESYVVWDTPRLNTVQYLPLPRGISITDFYHPGGLILCPELFASSAGARRAAAALLDDSGVDRVAADVLDRWPTGARRPSLDDFALPEMKGKDPHGFVRRFNAARERVERGLRAWLQDLLWLLESDVTDSLFIEFPVSLWDSHSFNLGAQNACWHMTVAVLERLFKELSDRTSPRGERLIDEIGLVASSELGRFPILNNNQGKDHLPQVSVFLRGPGLRTGQFGETDKEMIGLPVSAKTGFSSGSADDFVPTIDDVAATVLHWFGIEPVDVGYSGRVLEFLLDDR